MERLLCKIITNDDILLKIREYKYVHGQMEKDPSEDNSN